VRTGPSAGFLAALAALVLAGSLYADLQQIKAEPNLEKRSSLALDNAEDALKKAHDAYTKGDEAGLAALAQEIRESVELAETSLQQTGKNPRKRPRWFKHAEIVTRDLLRRLEAFRTDRSVDDRPVLDPVVAKVQQVHEDLLLGVMEGKEK
jgi:hypothetical protein